MIRTAVESQVLTFLARAAQNLADARRLLAAVPDRPPSLDAGELVRAVHDARVPGRDGSTPVEVERIITRPPVYQGLGATLERAGIALTEGRPGVRRRPNLEVKTCIFLDVESLLQKLLPPAWQNMDLRLILLNGLRGASPQQRMCAGRLVRGIEVPLTEWHAAALPQVPTEIK